MLRIETRHLRCVIAVEEAGSFTGAALRLDIAPSALSRCVRDLEDHLGISLFERLPRGVRPTRAGRAFSAAARNVLSRVDAAERAARDAGSGCEGALRIGFVWSFAAGPVVELLGRYAAAHPKVALHTVEDGQEALFASVSRGGLDVALTATDPPPFPPLRPLGELRRLPLWIEPLCAVMPTAVACRQVDWRMLADKRLVCRPDDDWQRFTQHVERASGHRLHFEQQNVARESFFGLVAAGLGWTIIPDSLSRLAIDGVRVVPIAEDSAALQIEAVWHPRADNPALTRFLALARRLFRTTEASRSRAAPSQTRDRSP